MEKVQAGLRRSQLKMQICGAWVFWSRRPKEEAQPEGRKRVRPGGGGSTKGSQKGEGVKSCRQGAPLVPKALSLFRQPEGAPRVWRKAVERSGGQSWLGQPLQLLVLLQFPHSVSAAPQEPHYFPGCLVLLLGEKGALVSSRKGA